MSTTTDVGTWTASAVGELLEAQDADGGWGYQSGQPASTEPAALAMLALSTIDLGVNVLPAAADWLTSRIRSDGLLSYSTDVPEASWASPLAGMALNQHGRTEAAETVARSLLSASVFIFDPGLTQSGIYGYDTTIPGWPWTAGDFSFVEPTSLAIIFLKQQGHSQSDPVRQGVSLLHDRALPAGGWNYGEPRVLGGDLFPTVLPTALSLLALADETDDTTTSGLDDLLAQRGQISSLLSLGWATIALNVHDALDEAWQSDVVTRWCELPAKRRDPMSTALCLLGLANREGHPFALG